MPAKSVVALTVAIAASLATGAEGFGLFPVAVALTRLNRHCPDGTFHSSQKLEPPTPSASRVRGKEQAGAKHTAVRKRVETTELRAPASHSDGAATPESSGARSSSAAHPTRGEDARLVKSEHVGSCRPQLEGDGIMYLHLHDHKKGIVERRLFYVRSRGGQKSCKVTQKKRALAVATLKQDPKYR